MIPMCPKACRAVRGDSPGGEGKSGISSKEKIVVREEEGRGKGAWKDT